MSLYSMEMPRSEIIARLRAAKRTRDKAAIRQYTKLLREATFKRSPLTSAAERGNLDDVRALLNTGHPIDETDYRGRTSLRYAVEARKPAIVYELGQAGNIKARDGLTPFDRARQIGNEEVLKAFDQKVFGPPEGWYPEE